MQSNGNWSNHSACAQINQNCSNQVLKVTNRQNFKHKLYTNITYKPADLDMSADKLKVRNLIKELVVYQVNFNSKKGHTQKSLHNQLACIYGCKLTACQQTGGTSFSDPTTVMRHISV